jgi:ABC-type glycerol-3-phosphate transport system substrate-binding protein
MDFYDFSYREWMLDTYFKDNLNAYVDAKNAKCYFDSESFTYILGKFGTLPTSDEIGELGEEWAAQRMPSYPESHLAFQENRAFIEDAVFCQPIDFRRYNRLTFHDEPVTMVGIPMDYDEGNGGLFRADFTVSVNAQSGYRAEIWDFMKHLLQEEYQSSLNDSFPVHLGALEAKYDEAMHMVSAKGYFGVSEVPIGESNAEEMGKLRTYLEGIQTAYYYDETIYNILWEETDKYLAGDQTAEECGRMVQSRVSIYLSEQS